MDRGIKIEGVRDLRKLEAADRERPEGRDGDVLSNKNKDAKTDSWG